MIFRVFLLMLFLASPALGDESLTTCLNSGNCPGGPWFQTIAPAAPSWATTPLSGAQIVSPTGGGTSCTVASPCSIAQAIINARGASGNGKYIYLRGNAGAYDLTPASANACGLNFNGNPAFYLNNANDGGEVWTTYPGDTPAVLDGSGGVATVVGYSSSATLSGTSLTLGGTVQGTWQAGQVVYAQGITTPNVVIQSGSGDNWTVTNPSSQSFSTKAATGTNAVQLAFEITSGNSNPPAEFYGLKFQHFSFTAVYTCNSHFTFENNEVTDAGNAATYSNDSAAVYAVNGHDTIINNNYIHDVNNEAINLSATTAGYAAGGIADNNMIVNSCIVENAGSYDDCGAFQYEPPGSSSGGTVLISKNYIRDVYKAGGGTNSTFGYCIYMDSTQDVIATGNICTGEMGVCFYLKGTNLNFTGNICTLTGGTSGTAIGRLGATVGSGVINFHGNIVVGNASGAAGAGWDTDSSGDGIPVAQNNLYYNYTAGGTVTNTCTQAQCGTGAVMDQYPVTGNPLLRCWGALMSLSSPATVGLVGYPQQPAAWDEQGFWGPVGMTMPQTGNSPVWPTTSGDGVSCLSTN
jgi:hypothetical protein